MIDDKRLEYLIDANQSRYCTSSPWCEEDRCECDKWTVCDHCHHDLLIKEAVELIDGKLICESCETKRTIKIN